MSEPMEPTGNDPSVPREPTEPPAPNASTPPTRAAAESGAGTATATARGDRDDGFRWRIQRRPDLRFGHAAGGVAGVLVAAAIVAFVAAVSGDDATAAGVAFNLVLIAIALFVGARFRGPVRAAAVAAIVVAVPQVWLFAVAGNGEGVDRGDFRLIMLLTIAVYLVLYAVAWTRGHAILLGLALLLAASWLVFEVADQSTPFGADRVPRAQDNGPTAYFGGDDNTTETAIAEILVAGALLGGGVVLDRRGRRGAATPFLLVGSLYAVAGALTLGADVDDVYAAGIFVVIAGLLIGLAGSLGRRRGTSWIGAAVLFTGTVAIVANGTDDAASGGDGAATAFGFFALFGAAVLLAIGIAIAQRLGEPVDGEVVDDEEPRPVGAPI